MATKTVIIPGGGIYVNPEDGNAVMLPGVGFFVNQPTAAAGGRILHIAGPGGLAGSGGIAGPHGGLAG